MVDKGKGDDSKAAGEFKINKDLGSVTLEINPEVYSLDVVYSAAYSYTRDNYILLDKSGKNILVEIKPKEVSDLSVLGKEFLNSLIRFEVYKQNSDDSKDLRYLFLQRALMINSPPEGSETLSADEGSDDLDDFDLDDLDDMIDDPDGIAVPWEEKYGKDKSKDDNKSE